jgi:hypothetical protein
MPHVRTDAEALEVAAVVDGEDEPCERKEEGDLPGYLYGTLGGVG